MRSRNVVFLRRLSAAALALAVLVALADVAPLPRTVTAFVVVESVAFAALLAVARRSLTARA